MSKRFNIKHKVKPIIKISHYKFSSAAYFNNSSNINFFKL